MPYDLNWLENWLDVSHLLSALIGGLVSGLVNYTIWRRKKYEERRREVKQKLSLFKGRVIRLQEFIQDTIGEPPDAITKDFIKEIQNHHLIVCIIDSEFYIENAKNILADDVVAMTENFITKVSNLTDDIKVMVGGSEDDFRHSLAEIHKILFDVYNDSEDLVKILNLALK